MSTMDFDRIGRLAVHCGQGNHVGQMTDVQDDLILMLEGSRAAPDPKIYPKHSRQELEAAKEGLAWHEWPLWKAEWPAIW